MQVGSLKKKRHAKYMTSRAASFCFKQYQQMLINFYSDYFIIFLLQNITSLASLILERSLSGTPTELKVTPTTKCFRA